MLCGNEWKTEKKTRKQILHYKPKLKKDMALPVQLGVPYTGLSDIDFWTHPLYVIYHTGTPSRYPGMERGKQEALISGTAPFRPRVHTFLSGRHLDTSYNSTFFISIRQHGANLPRKCAPWQTVTVAILILTNTTKCLGLVPQGDFFPEDEKLIILCILKCIYFSSF